MKKRMKTVFLALLALFCFLMAARIRFRQLALEDDKEEVKAESILDSETSDAAETNEGRKKENPDHIMKTVGDNLRVDADVTEGNGSYFEYGVELAKYPVEAAVEKLGELTGEEPLKPESADEDYWCYTPEKGYIGYVDGTVHFSRQWETDDTLYSVLQIWNARHKEESQEPELPFMSMQDAYALVREFIGEITQEECELIQGRALEEKDIEKCYQEVVDDGEVWDVDKETIKGLRDAYFLRIGCRRDGIPVYSWVEEMPVNSVMEMDVAKACSAETVVTREGIRYFGMDFPYNLVRGESRPLDILSAEGALDCALKSLKSQILDGETVVDNIYLEYVLIASESMWKPQLMRPYWVVEYTNTNEADGRVYVTQDAIRINAETGEDLAYGK